MTANEFYEKIATDLKILSDTEANSRYQKIGFINTLSQEEEDSAKRRGETIEKYSLKYDTPDGGQILLELHQDEVCMMQTLRLLPIVNSDFSGGVVVFQETRMSGNKSKLAFCNDKYEKGEFVESQILDNILTNESDEANNAYNWQFKYNTFITDLGYFEQVARAEHKEHWLQVLGGDEELYNRFFS